MTNPFLNRLNTIYRGSRVLVPFFSDLNTFYKKIVGTIFNESINNLPARFLPRVGLFNGSDKKTVYSGSEIGDIINIKIKYSDGTWATVTDLVSGSTTVSGLWDITGTDLTIGYDGANWLTGQIAWVEGYDSGSNLIFSSHISGQGDHEYELVNENHGLISGTGNHYDFDINGSTRPNDVGYSIWRKTANPDIQVQFDINGAAISLTAGVNIPAGYIHERDVPAGGANHNIYDSLVDMEYGSLLQNDTAGIAYATQNEAYGEWEFDIYKALTGNFMQYIIHNNSTTNGNGYRIQIDNNRALYLRKMVNGSPTTLCKTVNAYITAGIIYTMKIARSLTGEFTLYIKGGSFGSFYVLVNPTGGAGSNPVTDNTYTTSVNMVIDNDPGDQVSKIEVNGKYISPYDFTVSTGAYSIIDNPKNAIYRRSNATKQTATSRASLFFNVDHPFQYHIDEISDPRNSDTFFMPDYKNMVFQKVQTIGQEVSRLDELPNYATQKTGADLVKVQNYCGISDLLIQFSLLSTGDGTGVSTITLTVSENMTLTLDGAGKFYTDAGGTANESSTWDITTGAARTMYLKVTSGTSLLSIPKNKITNWGAWTSSTNAVSISGDISKLSVLTYLFLGGLNTLSGSIAGLTSLTYIRVLGSNTLSGLITELTSLTYIDVSGSNTLSGSVAALTSLTYLQVLGSNTLSGDISGLTSLTFLALTGGLNTLSGSIAGLTSLTNVQITDSNTLSGSIAGLTSLVSFYVRGSNTISGSVAALTSLTFLRIEGSNTVSGSIAGLTSLTYLWVAGSNTVLGDLNSIVSNLTQCFLVPCDMDTYTAGATWGNAEINIQPTGTGYDTTEIDNMLIDMAASVALIDKTITLTGTSAARSAASDAAVATLEGGGRNNTVITNP